MKTIAVVAIALLVVAASAEDLYRPGRRVTPRGAINVDTACAAATAGKTFCSTTEHCDAESIFICLGNGSGFELDCDGDTPNCVETTPGAAQCSKDPQDGCSPRGGSFQCLKGGIFPDPTNCHRYYNCYLPEGQTVYTADAYTCDDRWVFDPADITKKNAYCRLTQNANCIEIRCPGDVTKNFPMKYPTLPSTSGQIIATCRKNGAPLVTWCKASFIADSNPVPPTCKFQCTRAIKAEYEGDATKYNECKSNGRAWVASVVKCVQPGGASIAVFDPKIQDCVIRAAPATTTTAATTTATPTPTPTPTPTLTPTPTPTPTPSSTT